MNICTSSAYWFILIHIKIAYVRFVIMKYILLDKKSCNLSKQYNWRIVGKLWLMVQFVYSGILILHPTGQLPILTH